MSRWQITGSFVLVAVLMAAGGEAQATLLTFDDIRPVGSTQQYGNFILPNADYQGFNLFANTGYSTWFYLEGTYPYGAHSGEFALATQFSGAVGKIQDARGTDFDFTFDGLWAKKWGTTPESGGDDSLFGTLSGYNDDELIWSVATGLNGSYEYYGPQAGAIDELRLGFGANYLVDDILLNAIPEPSTLLLLATGALGLLLCIRRRR